MKVFVILLYANMHPSGIYRTLQKAVDFAKSFHNPAAVQIYEVEVDVDKPIWQSVLW